MKPDARILELCERLTSPGPINGKLSASEHHDVAEYIFGLSEGPCVVCLCGSTRFGSAFQEANLRETLAGKIVLSIGCNLRSDAELFADQTPDNLEAIKKRLDELHKRKIDLADEILVLNVDGYVGATTRSEIEYARDHDKRIRWLETPS